VLSKQGLLQSTGQLITDGGSENCGAIIDLLAKPGMLWKKLVAQVDITQSNSMAEAMNKIIKHRYLYRNVIGPTDDLQKLLPTVMADYNEMPQAYLHGLTPSEVLQGTQPDETKWRERIADARNKRLLVNQNARLDTC
jgi:putative transposase